MTRNRAIAGAVLSCGALIVLIVLWAGRAGRTAVVPEFDTSALIS